MFFFKFLNIFVCFYTKNKVLQERFKKEMLHIVPGSSLKTTYEYK